MNLQKIRVLVVDDDRRICELLNKFLTDQGFDVFSVSNAKEARLFLEMPDNSSENFQKSLLIKKKVDVLIVDVMMPEEDGISFLKSIGQKIPSILLTACDQILDKEKGFNVGADDYLTKPFEPLELSLRLKALVRRLPRSELLSTIQLGNFVFHIENGNLRDKEGCLVLLSSSELALLRIFAERPFNSFSREELSVTLGYKVGDRTVDVQIMRLRKKIEDDSKNSIILRTIRHVGYALYPSSS
jgi:two-component system phosphate regulon response regulator OmpR